MRQAVRGPLTSEAVRRFERMEENKTTRTIEETMEELEAIIEKMEDRESTLEESFACFETGMKLVKECSQRIDKVEKRIMVLSEENVEEYGS